MWLFLVGQRGTHAENVVMATASSDKADVRLMVTPSMELIRCSRAAVLFSALVVMTLYTNSGMKTVVHYMVHFVVNKLQANKTAMYTCSDCQYQNNATVAKRPANE